MKLGIMTWDRVDIIPDGAAASHYVSIRSGGSAQPTEKRSYWGTFAAHRAKRNSPEQLHEVGRTPRPAGACKASGGPQTCTT